MTKTMFETGEYLHLYLVMLTFPAFLEAFKLGFLSQ